MKKISRKTKKLARKGFIVVAQKDKSNCLVCTGCSSCTDGGGGGEGNGGGGDSGGGDGGGGD